MTPINQVRFYSWNSTIPRIRESAVISYAFGGSVLKYGMIFVGCILSLPKESDPLFEGLLTSRLLMKIGMNFAVPFLVSLQIAAYASAPRVSKTNQPRRST